MAKKKKPTAKKPPRFVSYEVLKARAERANKKAMALYKAVKKQGQQSFPWD